MASPNPFDAVMRGLQPEEPRKPQPSNPFDDVMRAPDETQQREMRTAQQVTKEVTPDRRAEAIRIAGQSGLSVDVVERDFENLSRQFAVKAVPYQQIQDQSPALASWLTDPNNAAVGRGDLEKMGNLEWVLKAPGRAFAQALNRMRYAELRTKSMFGPLAQDELDAMNSYKFNAERDGDLAAKGWWAKATTGAGRLLAQSVEPVKYGVVGGLETGTIGAGYGAATGSLAGGVGAGPGAVAGFTGGFGIGARAGVMYGVFKSSSMQEGAEAYDELLTLKDETGQTLDPEIARVAALTVGGINGLIEQVGLEAFAKNFPGIDKLASGLGRDAMKAALKNPSVRAGFKALAKRYAGSLSTEVATEVAQQGVQIAGSELSKYVAGGFDGQRRSPADVWNEMIDTAAESVPEFALGMLPGPTLNFVRDVHRAKVAEQGVQFFTAIGEGVEQSETATRLPAAMRAFVDEATKDGPVKTLYQPADSWVSYWKGQGLDPAKVAAEVTGNPNALDDALKTGQLAIQTADYAAKLAGTEHNAFLSQELRLSPDSMNGREMEEFKQKVDATKQRLAAERAAEREAKSPEGQAATQLTEQIAAQLNVPRETARVMAEAASGMANLAARAGFEPNDVLEPYGLTLQRKTAAELVTPAGEPVAPDLLQEQQTDEEIPGLADLEASLGGATVEQLGDEGLALNASGESAASQEALSRQSGMQSRGEQFVVYDRAGRRRPLLGPDAVDYNPRRGETYGVESPDGFRTLNDQGGRVPARGNTESALGRDVARVFGQESALPAIQSGKRHDGEWGETNAAGVRAQFIGYQPGYGDMPTHPLYNIDGGEFADSTVGIERLREQGIPIPPTPPLLEFNQRSIATSPAFGVWFGDSVVVDEQGDPLVVYHGTTQSFTRFDTTRANPEADFGAGFYFSNNPDEIAENYAGVGPDLQGKLEQLTERYQQELDESETGGEDGDAKRMAREELVTHEGLTMPVFLKMENPAVMGGPNETQLTFETEFDEETGDVTEERGTLIDFAEALRNATHEFYDDDVEAAVGRLFERGIDGISLREAVEMLKSDEGLIYATDDTGRPVSNEIIRRAIEGAGFDGIIDHTVNIKFGSERKTGRAMAGMDEDTVHYIVFKPTQIKSAIGNKGTFDAATPDILFQGSAEPSPAASVFFSKLDRALDESKLGRASGKQWKQTIKNAKIGVNRDEFQIAGVDDLKDETTYTKDELRAYFKQNRPSLSIVMLEGTGPTDEEIDEKASEIESEMADEAFNDVDWDDYVGTAAAHEDTIEDEEEVEVQEKDDDGDPLFDEETGEPVMTTEWQTTERTVYYAALEGGSEKRSRGYGYEPRRRDTEVLHDEGTFDDENDAIEAAEKVARERRDDMFDFVYEQVREGIDYSDAREEAERQLRDEGTGEGGRYSEYQLEPAADDDSYREVFLTAGNMKSGTKVTGPSALELADAMFGMGYGMLDDLQKAVVDTAFTSHQKTETIDYEWHDGHDLYKDVDNPIVRLRLNVRESLTKRKAKVEPDQRVLDEAVIAEQGLKALAAKYGVTEQQARDLQHHEGVEGSVTLEEEEQRRTWVRRIRAAQLERESAARTEYETGDSVLFLEEVQPPHPEEQSKMPPVFVKNWRELAFKWALRYAVDEGLSAVAWTTGQQQADRYSLEHMVDAISWTKVSEDTPSAAKGYVKTVKIEMRNEATPLLWLDEKGIVREIGNNYGGRWDDLQDQPLSMVIGDELAENVINDQADGKLSGKGLRVGGRGLKKLYDYDFVRVVNALPAVKKNGGRVSSVKIKAKPAYYVETREEMGDAALARQGFTDPEHQHFVVTGGGKIVVGLKTSDEAWDYVKANRYIDSEQPALIITPELAAAVSGGQAFLQSAKFTPQTPSEIETLNQQLEAVVDKAIQDAPSGSAIDAHVNSVGEIYIDSLMVPSEEQSRGVGTRMMRAVLDWADEHNMQVALDAAANPGKTTALERFYRRLGFIRNGTARFYDPASSGSRVRPALKDRMRRGQQRLHMTEKGPRGAIQFSPNRKVTITLFENADLSTFLHETGHFYLELMGDLVDKLDALDPATLTPSQQQVRADYATILEHIGVTNRSEIEREHHELFARSFEAYLMEGKAPSARLREAFARIRAWMLGVYRSLKALNAPLTDDVRKVFDRMLASDQAIADAQIESELMPMFLTPEQAGMSHERFALYRESIETASRSATERLDAQLMAEVQREQSLQWNERKAEVKAQVETETYAMPVYRAIHAMSRGKNPDGTPIPPAGTLPMKLSKKMLVDEFGKERLRKLPRTIYSAEGGLAPNTVAELFGFPTGDAMLSAVENAPAMRRHITMETDRRMLLEYGSLMLDGTLHDKARAAVADEQREAVLREELRALARKRDEVKAFEQETAKAAETERRYERRWFEAEARLRIAIAEGHQQVEIEKLEAEVRRLKGAARSGPASIRGAIPRQDVLRDAARASVAGTKVQDLDPRLYWSAARRASAAATEAAARQDFEEAIKQKHQELISLALYRESVRAKEEVEKRVKAAREVGKPSTMAKLRLAGETYHDQIAAMLDRFDFVKASANVLERRAALWRWVKGQESQGISVDIDEDLLDEAKRVNYQQLTVEELVGVTDAIKHLVYLARFKNRLLKSEGTRQLKKKVAELVASVRTHKDARPVGARDRRLGEERKRKIAGFAASHRKLSNLLREMDGWQDAGPMQQAIMFPLNAAGAREADMNAQATTTYHELIEAAYPKNTKRKLYQRSQVPAVGRAMSKMERVMIALNWGNEGNRDRIMRYEGWTAAQVQAVLDTLDENDARFVQGVFDWINGYWPEIAAKQERITGVRPEKVEASGFRIGGTELKGGYFPLKYDERLSASRAEMLDLEKANLAKQAAFTQATTKRGHTEARKATLDEPVRLDFGVISEHVQQVIHDLTHHETLMDVQKILASNDLKQAILETHGDIVLGQVRANLRDIAFGDLPAANHFEKVLNHTRVGATVVGLGWSLVTPLMQTLGLANSTVRLRPKWMAVGIGRMLGSPRKMQETVAWINEQSPMMKTRGLTQQRELNEIRNKVGVHSGRLNAWIEDALSTATLNQVSKQGIADSYFYLIAKMQQMVDVPTWLGAYEKAMSDGGAADGSHELAVAIADQAVLDTQGGGQMKDLAEVQRGAPAMRLFTNFYTAGSVLYNQAVEVGKVTKFTNAASVGRMLVDYLTLFIVPATASYFIHQAFRPGDDDDDLGKGIAQENLAYLLGTMLGFREFTGAVQGYYGYEGPAGLRIFNSTGKAIKQIAQGELDEPLLKSLNDVMGLLFHYPATAVWKFAQGASAIAEGETENPAMLFTGPEK